MDVHFFTHGYNGKSTARATSGDLSESALLVLIHDDGSTVKIYGPPEAKEAFARIAELFNEAHHPKPKEIEHLGTVALDEA